MQPEGVLNDSLKSGVWLLLCLCALVVHKLLDYRKQVEDFEPLPVYTARRCFCLA